MKKLLNYLKPPAGWRLPVIILLGIFTGFALFVLHISKAPSYLSDRPEACTNCHIMAPQYATWSHSSHREWTHCNDCHVPHNNFVNKYYFKANDGLRHATIFTLRNEPQVIQIRHAGIDVVQDNCLRCHEQIGHGFKYLGGDSRQYEEFTERLCWDCHREVPHGRVRSLSSTPWAIVPLPDSPVPDWIRSLTEETN
ncbi:MAG: cytochrome c nitrite reductase small subunit [Bacteroidales bacterium]|jgi:cytochrome c nitrite reductase small subunit|nr:cytochrome c nitrite reductase small subunit [Bacteroidales bacterium]